MRAEDWIRVEDGLPEAKYRLEEKGYSEGVLVLVKMGSYYDLTNAIYDHLDEKWYDGNDRVIDNVTHWMQVVLPKKG